MCTSLCGRSGHVSSADSLAAATSAATVRAATTALNAVSAPLAAGYMLAEASLMLLHKP